MRLNFKPQGMLAVPHLRFKRLWLVLGIAMLLIVAVASIMALPAPVQAVMFHDKLMHALAYGCLMGWFAQIYRHDLTRLLLVITLIGMGVIIEYIQGTVPERQYDVLDMVANTTGVLVAWVVAYTWMGNILSWFESIFRKP